MPTEAQNRATTKYKKNNYKRVPLEVKLQEYDQIKAAAAAAGETVSGYIKAAVNTRMQADQADRQEEPAADQAADQEPMQL